MKKKKWLSTKEAAARGLNQRQWQNWARAGIIPKEWVKKVNGRWFIHTEAFNKSTITNQ